MDLITKTMLLREVNSDFAKQISQKWGIAEDEVQLVRKGLVPSDFKFAENEKATIDYITTKTVDRDGDIVEPSGADLSHYIKNPVVLWCHDYKQLPLGKNAWIKADNNGLVAKTIYAVKANPFAKQVYDYRKDGFPLAKSIGFVPLQTNPNITKGVKRHFLKYLVLEYSDCPIPSNPDAIGLAVSKGLLKPTQAKYFFYDLNDDLIIDGEHIVDNRYINKSQDKERYSMDKDVMVDVEEKKKKLEEEDKEKPKEEEKPEGEGEEEKPEGEGEEEKPEGEGEEEDEDKKKKKAKVVEVKCEGCGEMFTPTTDEKECKMCSSKKPKKKEIEDEDIVNKKAPDVTENYIRIRQKDPSSFQEGSFRIVTLSEKDGISSVMGKLKGEDTMSIQTYLFDKEKWSTDAAVKWVEDHKKKAEKYLEDYMKSDWISFYEDWLVEEETKAKKVACKECGEEFTPEGDEKVCPACAEKGKEKKIYDSSGRPSIFDIMSALGRKVRTTTTEDEPQKITDSGVYRNIVDIFPYEYPNGTVIVSISNGGNSNSQYYEASYTYDVNTKEADIGELKPVEQGYVPKSLDDDLSIKNKLDDLIEVLADKEDEVKSLTEENDDLVSKLDELSYYNQIYEDENNILKEGRVLSSKNANLIQKCITDMNTAISSLQALLEATSVSKSIDEIDDVLDIVEEEGHGSEEKGKSSTSETKVFEEEEIVKIFGNELAKFKGSLETLDLSKLVKEGLLMKQGKVI